MVGEEDAKGAVLQKGDPVLAMIELVGLLGVAEQAFWVGAAEGGFFSISREAP